MVSTEVHSCICCSYMGNAGFATPEEMNETSMLALVASVYIELLYLMNSCISNMNDLYTYV